MSRIKMQVLREGYWLNAKEMADDTTWDVVMMIQHGTCPQQGFTTHGDAKTTKYQLNNEKQIDDNLSRNAPRPIVVHNNNTHPTEDDWPKGAETNRTDSKNKMNEKADVPQTKLHGPDARCGTNSWKYEHYTHLV
jgi:FtsZ-interacting cell division protein ZipA